MGSGSMRAEDSRCLRDTGPAPGLLEKQTLQSVSAEPDRSKTCTLNLRQRPEEASGSPRANRCTERVGVLVRESP